jgi:hypothetical protein
MQISARFPVVLLNMCCAVGVVAITTGDGKAKDLPVDSNATLNEALSTVEPGDRILLAPGVYTPVALGAKARFDKPVTITSQNKSTPAAITELNVTGSKNLVFDSLTFDYTYTEGDPLHKRIVNVADAQGVTFQNCIFDGDLTRNTGIPDDDGFASGIGLFISKSVNVRVQGNSFRILHRGGVFDHNVNITVASNELKQLRSDGFDFVGGHDILIEKNYMHDFHRSLTSPDHPDMIQFWTRNTSVATSAITIRDNFLDAGLERETQSIFLGNEAVMHEGAGPEMYFQDVKITGNVVRNGHIHAISIGASNNVLIENNTILQMYPPAETKSAQTPHIIVDKKSTNVSILRNVVPRIQQEFRKPVPTWTIEDNYEAQRNKPGLKNSYQNVFVNALARKSMTLEDLAVLPNSEIAGQNLGSAQLQFNSKPAIPVGIMMAHATIASGLEQQFDATWLYGPDGRMPADQITSVKWDFGDGSTGEGLTTLHHFARIGFFEVKAHITLAGMSPVAVTRTIEIGLGSSK